MKSIVLTAVLAAAGMAKTSMQRPQETSGCPKPSSKKQAEARGCQIKTFKGPTGPVLRDLWHQGRQKGRTLVRPAAVGDEVKPCDDAHCFRRRNEPLRLGSLCPGLPLEPWWVCGAQRGRYIRRARRHTSGQAYLAAALIGRAHRHRASSVRAITARRTSFPHTDAHGGSSPSHAVRARRHHWGHNPAGAPDDVPLMGLVIPALGVTGWMHHRGTDAYFGEGGCRNCTNGWPCAAVGSGAAHLRHR